MSHITRIAVSANITDTSLLHKAIEYCKLKCETGGDRIYVTIPNHSWRLVLSKIDGLYSASSESYVASDAQQTMQRIISGYNLAQALQTSEYAAADEIEIDLDEEGYPVARVRWYSDGSPKEMSIKTQDNGKMLFEAEGFHGEGCIEMLDAALDHIRSFGADVTVEDQESKGERYAVAEADYATY